MPVMTDVQAVAANATTANVLAGKQAEFLGANSVVQLAATGSLPGLHTTLVVGDEVVIEDQEISDRDAFPILPDDVVAEAGGVAGERIILKYRNSTGGSITARTKVTVLPI